MVTRKLLSIAVFVALLLVGVSAFAQTTGTLTGTVTTAGSALPGATVSLSSPALQGVRTSVTGVNGDYVFPALPPGRYSVTFELEGMQKVTKTADIRLSETARTDADLGVSKVAEAITVTATAPSVLETTQVSTSLTREQVEALPIGRTILQRIQLAPGVNNSGPNNQTTINGAPSFDNLYLINGVVVNDSIRGQPENLFIEDAVQETTLLTGGVSAEYGRFTGGVVNTITKSGGNQFSGSFRDNLTNPSWTEKTPFPGDAKPASTLLHQYEATLGGYLLRDRLWFFGAGRKFNQSIANTLVLTNIPYINQLNNKRYEAKLTGQITSKHSIVGSYMHNNTLETNNRFGNVVDLRGLSDRELPNWLEDFHYSGVITNSLLVEGLYSRRYFAFVGGGGPKDDLINGTLLRDNTTARRMWSATFCACDPKSRNNKDYLAKVNYFLTTKSMGSHNVIGGYDDFHELRHENNYQSGSNFRLWGDFSAPQGADKTVYFHANPTNGFVTINPIGQASRTNDVATKSFFVNDKWDFSNHFSFNVGVRYDKDKAQDQTHNTVATDSGWSPRLGVIYDIKADGRDRISASYSKYLSHIDSGVADSVSVAGNPGSIYFNYRGPDINPLDKSGNVIGTPVPTAEVIKQVFDWFNSVGGVTGYKSIDSISVPGLTARIAPGGLKSPYMNEITLGYGHQIGSAGYVRADIIHRDWHDFYTQ
ncbi:MAG TPA: TonB-dependent receptor, partial [Thermoanaerobaculia bacterium]|nr:TonB-dependent receptor [Thermoanaerobaculia bacterium]